MAAPVDRCGACGYFRGQHDALGKCPLCACGEVLAAHGPAHECPGGRTSATTGKPLLLRQATFREPAPDGERRDWFGLSVPVMPAEREVVVEEIGPPLVPARPPHGPTEFAGAGGGRQGSKLGRNASRLGWTVSALYWQGHDGSEGCGVWLAKAALRAVALWKRGASDAGKTTGWAADVAYAWRTDVARFPTKLTHTDLERLIT